MSWRTFTNERRVWFLVVSLLFGDQMQAVQGDSLKRRIGMKLTNLASIGTYSTLQSWAISMKTLWESAVRILRLKREGAVIQFPNSGRM